MTIRLLSALALLTLAPPALAAEQTHTATPAAIARIAQLAATPAFAKARASLAADWDRIVADVIALTQIPAPPFAEAARAKAYADLLRAHGLADVGIDREGNATGLRRGTDPKAPLLVVSAHLDTVFPAGTDVTVKRTAARLAAPGVGDDSCSLAVLLAFVRALDRAQIRTKSDILFVGNVGEEGPGDLRGMRFLFGRSRYTPRIARMIAFEPGRNYVTTGGIGSKRFRVEFHGPGGHSYGAFGLVNPAQAMANAIVAFGAMQVPKSPKTTFNVGIVEGGTSVNSIPHDVAMTIDLRSEDAGALQAEVDQLTALLPEAVAAENAARSTAQGPVTYELKPVGDRAVGRTPPESDLVQLATAAIARVGGTPAWRIGSTDSNIPMGLGIPAVTLGSGFLSTRAHALDESLALDRHGTLEAMEAGLATIVAVAEAP